MARDTLQYDAFISYRHSELDSFVAETLHKQLENFKLPKNVSRQKSAQAGKTAHSGQSDGDLATDYDKGLTEQVKTRIQRVFRDKEELPLVTNLADPITEALQNSEYLIVICSPRLPESMWCRKEIETFIEMHDREHVLAVLAEGEPDTSFPEELLYREVEESLPDGSVIKRRVPVEPLAADVRGTSHKEIRKKIKSELLRLVAPMFDCNYDDLKQRHKEQKARKIIMTSMSVSTVCLLFGIVSTAMALQIKKQNTQIKAQSDEITAQAQEIEQQYQEAKRNTAISRSREAVGYLEEGDRMRAVETAQNALLDLSGTGKIEEDMNYPAEAVYALTDSLYLYENGQQVLPDRILEADTTVRTMKLTPQGSRLLTVDDSGQVIVWNPEDMAEQIKIDATLSSSNSTNDAENEIAFLGEDCVFCPVENEIVLYNVSEGSAIPTYRIQCDDYVGIIVLQEKKQAIVLSESGYQAVDCSNGSLLYAKEWDMNGLAARSTLEYASSEDGMYWAVSLAAPYIETHERQIARVVAVYSTVTGERTNVYPIDYEYIKSIRFDEDRIYVVSNQSAAHDTTRVKLGMKSRLQAFAIDSSQTPLWTYERQNGWMYETSYAHMDDSNYLLCSGYSDVVVLDKRDGSYIDLFGFGVEVIKLGNYSGSDNFMVFTRDGVWHYLSMERMEDMVGVLFPACTSTNVMDFAIGDGYCVTLPYGSRRVTVYRTASGEGLEEFYQSDYNYKEAILNSGGSYMAASFYNDSYKTAVDMFDTGTGSLLWRYEDDTFYKGMTFVDYDGQEALALLTSKEVIILEPEKGERLASDQLEFGVSFDYIGCSKGNDVDGEEQDQRYFYLWDDETLYGYDIVNMELAYKITHDRKFSYDDVVALADNPKRCYVITDKEEGALHFYRMGEEIYTYGGQEDALQQNEINYKYIETMFFDNREGDEHLYIVYMDGRITRMDIDFDNDADGFCTFGSIDEASEKYNGLEEVMRGYDYHTGDDCAVMRGNNDAYLLTAGSVGGQDSDAGVRNGQDSDAGVRNGQDSDIKGANWQNSDVEGTNGQDDAAEDGNGDILAHLHGFLCYDSTNRQIYLTNSRTIYRVPLYTLEEINEIASKVRGTL